MATTAKRRTTTRPGRAKPGEANLLAAPAALPAAAGSGEDWPEVDRRLDGLRAVLPALADLPPAAPESILTVLTRIAEEVEALRRRGIRDRIQLAGLRELMESLLRGGDPEQDLLTVVRYLRTVLEQRQVLLLRRLPGDGWMAYHAGGLDPAGTRWGPFDEPDGSDVAEAARPGCYPLVLPLGAVEEPEDSPPSGTAEQRAAGGSSASGDEYRGAFGLLCLSPGASPRGEEGDPREVARSVEAVLGTLYHRQELGNAARFRRQLLESMGDGLLACDGSGTILELNAAMSRLLGIEAAAALGRHVGSLSPRCPGLVREIEEALGSTEARPPFEVGLGDEEHPLPVNVSITPLTEGPERRGGVVVTLADLSRLRELEEQMRRLDRLAALGRLAAWVAHEIRNPLAGIGAGVEYLKSRLPADAPEQSDLRFLLAETARPNRIVSELLDYARPRPLALARCEVAELIPRIRQSVEPLLAGKGMTLEERGALPLGFTADPDRVQQVLLNLLKNAIEAAPGGSAVTLDWSVQEGFSGGSGEEGPPRPLLRFLVKDRGPGMSAQEQTRAFEPFYTTKGSGTGLGLHMSRAIAEQHGGTLRLLSIPGEGTTAVFEIPSGGKEGEASNAIIRPDR